MADAQIGNNLGVAARAGTGQSVSNLNGGTADNAGLDVDNADTISAMRTRLAAIDATFYPAARLNTMTFNDMVYALRVADNNGSI